MNITIIGAGSLAKGLAARFADAGHSVTIAGRDEAKAEAAARAVGPAVRSAPIAEISQAADIVVLAVPYDAAAGVIAASGGLAGKVIIDVTNPMNADFSGLSIGHTTSAAEEIQKIAPGARVVKAFNTISAQVLRKGASVSGRPATVYVAGDDANDRAMVAELAQRAGFEAVETGDLSTARYLEPLAALNITLAMRRADRARQAARERAR